MSYTISAAEQPTLTIRSSTFVKVGWALSGVPVLFLFFDAAMKVLRVPIAIETSAQLGYSAETILPLGMLQLVLLVLYLTPRLAPLGALLWTAYLGGAVATHFRVANPLFTHMLFPTYVAAMLWAGLWLRDARVRALVGRIR